MNILANFDKYKSFFPFKKRLILINFLILTSLFFVIFKNINEIRYKSIVSENGEVLLLDRFTSKVRIKK